MITEVIAASAGTGKTFRLAGELRRELLDANDPVAPERVVAVTFTRAAAAELHTRVRRALLDDGRIVLARRLAAARIGTLHAVCARLVREHAFALGLSPELRTLDEALADHAIRTALEQQVSEDERTALEDLDERLGGFAWQQAVKQIIDCARLNGLTAVDLERCADLSVSGLLAALPAPGDGAALERELLDVVDKILAGPAPRVDSAREEWIELNEMRRALRRGEAVPWSSWLSLEDSHWLSALRRFGFEHVTHPRLRTDLEAAVREVFGVAGRAISRYDDDKRAWGVFDFVDQETFALRLLRDKNLRPLLREQIGLVLVDEFQDTSPLQWEILDELRGIAKKTVFVGDPKQAIYGFRGTAPDLLEKVVALATTHAAALDVSYRSRPGLVALTSALFEPPFRAQGIPAEHVRVRAALEVEPAGLGPFLERWRLKDGRSAFEIAAGVRELLDDETVVVRAGDGVRRARPRDVAVLARTNRHARDIADALLDAGIPAVLRRRGLAATVEARALAAGLALFHDSKDALAAAELTRLTRGAVDPNVWLTDLVTHAASSNTTHASPASSSAPPASSGAAATRSVAFVDDVYVAAAGRAGAAHRQAGVVLAVDLVVEALRLRDVCASWGDTAQRLANLGALRALAVRFVEERAATGAAATVVGFLARLEHLADADERDDDRDDDQGDVSGQDAVEISTWHKSKGREWPIVVLAQLVYLRPPEAWGVHVEREQSGLADGTTWVRYWPSPYGERSADGGLNGIIAGHEKKLALDAAARREELRLLYVGWTRARDRLVLPGPVVEETNVRLEMWSGQRSILRLLADNGNPLVAEPDEKGHARWAGLDVDVVVRAPEPKPKPAPELGERAVVAPLPARSYAPAFLAPSSLDEVGVAGAPTSLGTPFILRAFADEDVMARLGTAVHGLFAADPCAHVGAAVDDVARHRLATRLLTSYDVRHLIGSDDVVTIADRLWRALDARYPGARAKRRVQREAFVTQRLPEGTVVRGQMDLVMEVDDGFVIVDHKTYVTDDAVALSATFAGQLRCYARALSAAAARPVVETLVHLPLSGVLVAVR